MRKQFGKISMSRSPRRRFSPLALAAIVVPVILIIIAGGSFLTSEGLPSYAAGARHKHGNHKQQTHKKQQAQQQQAQQQQQATNCTLTVPANPLSAQGLATPYQLGGGCTEANKMQAAFVQGAVIDPKTGQISIYDPLVVDQGTQPAITPVMPTLPAGGIVALWFGFNGTNLTLEGTRDPANGMNSLTEGMCVNGLPDSIFGQVSYCNAPAFFQAANTAIQNKLLTIPALGNANAPDGQTCPTVRDFSTVDQDQSDNVTTTYLITANGQIAQDTAANMQQLQGAQTQTNGSDDRLLAIALDGALGCTPFMAPDLANNGAMTTAQPLNELQAAANQKAPVALVPLGDPMTLVGNNTTSTAKTDLYRAGVDQPPTGASDGGNTNDYCTNLRNIAPQRIATDSPLTGVKASPDPAAANSLFTFLAQRFQTTFEGPLGTGLACAAAGQGPIQAQKDANGVAISATITVQGQTTCFDNKGQQAAMTLCMNNANAMNMNNKATNNSNGNGAGTNQQQQGQQRKQGKSHKRRHG